MFETNRQCFLSNLTKGGIRVQLETEEYMTIEQVNGIREKAGKLRRQFLKYKDAEIVYSLTHRKLLEMADEAGAIYRIDGTVLINRDIFDEYLEQFHQKPCTYSAYMQRKQYERERKEQK